MDIEHERRFCKYTDGFFMLMTPICNNVLPTATNSLSLQYGMFVSVFSRSDVGVFCQLSFVSCPFIVGSGGNTKLCGITGKYHFTSSCMMISFSNTITSSKRHFIYPFIFCF